MRPVSDPASATVAAMKRTLVLAIGFAFVAAPLTGCGDETPSGAVGDLSAPSTSVDPSDDLPPVGAAPEATPETAPETAPDVTPEPTPETTAETRGDIDDVACLEGAWELDGARFVEQLNEFANGPGSIEFGGGRYITEFAADGTYVSRREAFTIRIVTPEGTVVATTDSTGSGSFIVNDAVPGDFEGEITIVDDVDDATVSIGFEMGGVVVPMPEGIPMTFDVPTAGLGGTSKYICFADDPASLATGVTLEDGTIIASVFNRP